MDMDMNMTNDCIHNLTKGFDLYGCFNANISTNNNVKFTQINKNTIALNLIKLHYNEYCFTVQYMAMTQSKLKVLFRSPFDNVRDNILTIKPIVRKYNQHDKSANFQTSEFCLRDLVAIQSGDVELAFTIDQDFDQSQFFGLKIDVNYGTVPMVLTTLKYLNSMEMDDQGNDRKSWASDWLTERKINTFEIKEDSIYVTGKCKVISKNKSNLPCKISNSRE